MKLIAGLTMLCIQPLVQTDVLEGMLLITVDA